MFDRYTERVRLAIAQANQEAVARGGDSIEVPHMLLGMLAVAPGMAMAAMHGLGVDVASLRRRMEERLPPRVMWAQSAKLRMSSSLKKTVEAAIDEAKVLGHDYVGTEHVLLAMLDDAAVRETVGSPAITKDSLRAKVRELLARRG